jgi:hypothetical protein
MNKILLALVATASFSLTPAFAATKNTNKAKAAKTSAQAAAPEVTASSAASIPAPAVNNYSDMSVSMPVSAAAPTKSKYSYGFTSENWAGVHDINTSNTEGAVAGDMYVKVGYKLTTDIGLEFRQYAHYNSTSATQTDEMSMGEHVFIVKDASLAKINDNSVAAYARLYVPGTALQNEVGQVQVRLGATVEQKFAKTTVEYALESRSYAYTQNSDGQVAQRLLPGVSATYEVNKVISPFVGVSLDSRWYNHGVGKNIFGPSAGKNMKASHALNKDLTLVDLGANITLSKNIGIQAYVENDKNLDNSNEKFDLFDDNRNTYNLNLMVSM